jgi:hypothetical protein
MDCNRRSPLVVLEGLVVEGAVGVGGRDEVVDDGRELAVFEMFSMTDQDFGELGETFTRDTMLVGVGQQIDLARTDRCP